MKALTPVTNVTNRPLHLLQLTTKLAIIEADLSRALQRDDDTEGQARLLRLAADLMDMIEAHLPRDRGELRAKIRFFLRRSTNPNAHYDGARDRDIALDLINSFDGDWQDHTTRALYCQTDALDALVRDPVSPQELVEIVKTSEDRVSIIDTNYRFTATSRANAGFHGRPVMQFIGTHIAETIGLARFNDIVRARLDASFAGEKQEYYNAIETQADSILVIRCRMTPLRDPIGRVYATLVRLNDATGVMPHLDSNRSKDLKRA